VLDAATCEFPEGIWWKDHLRRRNRRPRVRINRPTTAYVPNQRPGQRAAPVLEYDDHSRAIFGVQRLIGLGKGGHQGVEQRIEEFGRAESWPLDGVADLYPVFAVVARHIQPRQELPRHQPTRHPRPVDQGLHESTSSEGGEPCGSGGRREAADQRTASLQPSGRSPGSRRWAMTHRHWELSPRHGRGCD
jgi:hypothetical protein